MAAALLVGSAEIMDDTELEGKLCCASQQVAFPVASGPFQPSGPPGASFSTSRSEILTRCKNEYSHSLQSHFRDGES